MHQPWIFQVQKVAFKFRIKDEVNPITQHPQAKAKPKYRL